jgi:hypothetical protein
VRSIESAGPGRRAGLQAGTAAAVASTASIAAREGAGEAMTVRRASGRRVSSKLLRSAVSLYVRASLALTLRAIAPSRGILARMSQRWLAVVVVLAGCGSQREDRPPDMDRAAERATAERARKSLIASRDEQQRPTPPPPTPQDLQKRPGPPDPTLPIPPAAHRAAIQPAPPPPEVTCLSPADVVSFEAKATLRACLDSTGDGEPDQCARWRPGGALMKVEPFVEQEGVEPPADPVTFHSDTEHNDDSRIELNGGVVEICPYDRVCLKLMPRLDDGELSHVAADADFRRAALVIRGSDSKQGAVELWDLERGRRYAKLPYRGLRRDDDYTFSVKLGPGALIAIAERDRDSEISGAIYGLDGGYRGALGGGSPTLDGASTLETAGLFAIVDPQTDEKPYIVHVVDLTAGGAASRFVIPREPEADAIKLHRVAPGVIVATQWGKQVRLDVIDPRRGGGRVLRAPAC